jgi:hypothetical protein
MKTEIKNSTEITGFVEVITRIPDSTAANDRRSNRKLFILKIVIKGLYLFKYLLGIRLRYSIATIMQLN